MSSADILRLAAVEQIVAVMILWDRRLNTADIARRLHQPEHEIVRLLRIGRERRRTGCAQ